MLNSNPGDPALVFPTALAFGGVLATSFTGILAVERRRLDRLFASALFQKWLTWAVIAPLFLAAMLFGEAGAAALVCVAVTVALIEYGALVKLSAAERVALVAGGIAIVATVAFAREHLPETLIAATLFIAAVALARQDERGFGGAAVAGFGLVYIAVLLSHAMFVADLDGGAGLLLAIAVAVALSDVCAFCVGKALGRHKLAPRLSPNKTWEGVAGNVIGAYAAFSLMSFALPESPLATRALLPAVVAVAGVAGDLFESMLKRTHSVKDAGDWLPGFGGLLDRIDSLIFALPAAYLALVVLS